MEQTRIDELIATEQTKIKEYQENKDNIDRLIAMEQTKIGNNRHTITELKVNQITLDSIVEEDANFYSQDKNTTVDTTVDTPTNVLQKQLKITDANAAYYSLMSSRYLKLLQTIKEKNTTQDIREGERLFNEISIKLIEEEIRKYKKYNDNIQIIKSTFLDKNNDSTNQSLPTFARSSSKIGRSKSSSALNYEPLLRQSSSSSSSSALNDAPLLRQSSSSNLSHLPLEQSSSKDGKARRSEKGTPLEQALKDRKPRSSKRSKSSALISTLSSEQSLLPEDSIRVKLPKTLKPIPTMGI